MARNTFVLLALLAFSVTPALAQTAPQYGIKAPPLPAEPQVFDTAEQHGIKLTVLTKAIGRPFGMAFLPDGDLLISERAGELRIVHKVTSAQPVVDPAPVPGLPRTASGKSGLLDIALHPDFARNHWLYFSYLEDAPDGPVVDGTTRQTFLTLKRGKLDGGKLTGVETLIKAGASFPTASRVLVAKDGKVWMTSGGPFDRQSQELGSLNGKVLRLNEDGSIPADNPFVGKAGANGAVYSYGHRDQHGLTINPATGQVFTAEHGPNGGDEANLIKPGGNYGWPDYSFGREYDGSPIGAMPLAPGIERPVVVWLPSIAPTCLYYYSGDKFPAWKGNLFTCSARRGEVNGTGGIERVVLNDKLGELRREMLLTQFHKRVRNIKEGPDGNLYVLIEGDEGAVLRIEPQAIAAPK
jgi:glucose/arabinose dehydrogenase